MAAKTSTALRNAILGTDDLAASFTPVFLYFYDGPVPATAEDPTTVDNTLLCKMAASTDGTTGATWTAAANGTSSLNETVDGLILVDGTPTFMRICMGADDGSSDDTVDKALLRWQDTAGGPGNAIVFSVPAFDADGSSRKGLTVLTLQIPAG